MVTATAAILILAIYLIDKPSWFLMTGINGIQANQAKKAIYVIWNARICGILKLKSLIAVALVAFVVVAFIGAVALLVMTFLSHKNKKVPTESR